MDTNATSNLENSKIIFLGNLRNEIHLELR